MQMVHWNSLIRSEVSIGVSNVSAADVVYRLLSRWMSYKHVEATKAQVIHEALDSR
jgi:hypothetical protein